MNIQPAFRPLVDAALAAATAAFAARLSAFYLHGSIAQGDAVPNVSDLDAMLILCDAVSKEDRALQSSLQQTLAAQFPLADEIHLNLLSMDDLSHNSFACFALKYNATLLYGQDATDGLTCPAPDAAMARSRLTFAKQCFADALCGKQPACTGPLPADPYWRARKFARYFVVIEGAYYLMSQGKFLSFHKQDVLPALLAAAPQFSDALMLTQSILQDAQSACIDAEVYLSSIKSFVNWLFTLIDMA